MKKLALALLIVCFVLSTGFAQEFKPEVSVTGSGTAKVGFNLDTGVFGMKNDVSAGIKLTLVPKATAEKTQDSGAYGYIKLADFRVIIDDEDVFKIEPAVVTAKIVSGPLFVTIMDEGKRDGSNKTKSISAGQFGLPNITDGKLLSAGVVKLPASAPAGSYIYAGYDTDMLDVTVKASTTNDWCLPEADAANDSDGDGEYDPIWYINPAVAVTVSGITAKAGAIFSTVDSFNTGFGASLSYELALNDKVKIVPTAGFDMELADPDSLWAVGGGVFAKWGGNDETDYYFNLSQSCLTGVATGADVKHQGGAGVAAQYTSDGMINAILQVNEQRGDDGLVPGLGAGLGVELFNLTQENDAIMTMKIGFFANYKVSNITPFVRGVYSNGALEADTDDSFTLALGAEVASMLPNTTLNIDYSSWNLMADTNNKGVVTAAVKIAF